MDVTRATGTKARCRLRVILAAAIALAGCAAGEMGMSDSTYVGAMADLQRLERTARDSASQTQRDSIMAVYGVTPEELEEVGEWLSQRPEEAAQLWRQIDRRSRMAEP